MNFTPEDFRRGLYFLTFTFNSFGKQIAYTLAPWNKNRTCPVSACQQAHFYQQINSQISSFLAEKETAQKKLGRDMEGVNDLFAKAIREIVEKWKPVGFKWVAVPELHKCQTLCHWQGQKKAKKASWKKHSESYCRCSEKHNCLRNWHIHMIATDFLPPKYQHQKCGLGTYNQLGNPRGCWDHRYFIAHEIWPYGLTDIKRICHLKVKGKSITSSEQLVVYLAKYLAKAFEMRADPQLSQQVGLLKGMSIYKFFRVIYGYHPDNGRPFVIAKIQKPQVSSRVFINNDYQFTEQIAQEFSPYFAENLRLKKQVRKIFQSKEPPTTDNGKLTNLLKTCLFYSSRSKIKQNSFWKPCDTSDEEAIWTKGKGWKVNCPIPAHHHTEPLIRWEFEFQGEQAYSDFHKIIRLALAKLSLPTFTKFQDFQPQDLDYIKFAHQAKLPWNKEIYPYSLDEMTGITNEWKSEIPTELIYNYVYLKEIRSQISVRSSSWGLSAENSAKRYADY